MAATEMQRQRIVSYGLDLASRRGLNALSLGEIARDLELPRSGLASQFASPDLLQAAVLEEAAQIFARDVVEAVGEVPQGERRLEALFRKWLVWSRSPRLKGGCPFVHASAESASLPPGLRTRLRELLDQWNGVLRAQIEAARGCPLAAGVDADQLIFELNGLYLSHHFWHWSMRDANAFQRTIKAYERLLAASRG